MYMYVYNIDNIGKTASIKCHYFIWIKIKQLACEGFSSMQSLRLYMYMYMYMYSTCTHICTIYCLLYYMYITHVHVGLGGLKFLASRFTAGKKNLVFGFTVNFFEEKLWNRILNNNSSIGVPNDHGKHGALIIIAEEQGYNEYQ